MTNEQHNRYIAYTFLGHGIFQLFMLLIIGAMFFFMFSFPGRSGDPDPPMEFFGLFFGFMILFQLAFTVPSFVASYALLRRKSWAKIASIIAGVLASMSVPVGTAACVYSLWFFLGDNWKSVYGGERGTSVPEPHQIAYGQESRWGGYQTDETGEVTYRPAEPPDWR